MLIKTLHRNITCSYQVTRARIAVLWGGADKSLARAGRKQATANKLGICSTNSPRSSSIHFLARCSNFCKPLKKKNRKLSVQPACLLPDRAKDLSTPLGIVPFSDLSLTKPFLSAVHVKETVKLFCIKEWSTLQCFSVLKMWNIT